MKEHPIIFSTDMVKAIRDGRKTQTRRVITVRNKRVDIQALLTGHQKGCGQPIEDFSGAYGCKTCGEFHWDDRLGKPYGQVGDRLWVRETHKFTSFGFALSADVVYKDGQTRDVTKVITDGTTVYNEDHPEIHKWRPSIFMPRWASRITLEITAVRVERVQDISIEDAFSEATPMPYERGDGLWNDPYVLPRFQELWDSINGKKYPWESNPWCWCISFKKLD